MMTAPLAKLSSALRALRARLAPTTPSAIDHADVLARLWRSLDADDALN